MGSVWDKPWGTEQQAELEAQQAASVRSAVEQEREACAGLAEAVRCRADIQPCEHIACDQAAAIAAAIRARGSKPEGGGL